MYVLLDEVVRAADKRTEPERSGGLQVREVVKDLVAQGRDSDHGKLYLNVLASRNLLSYDLAVLYDLDGDSCDLLFSMFGGPVG